MINCFHTCLAKISDKLLFLCMSASTLNTLLQHSLIQVRWCDHVEAEQGLPMYMKTNNMPERCVSVNLQCNNFLKRNKDGNLSNLRLVSVHLHTDNRSFFWTKGTSVLVLQLSGLITTTTRKLDREQQAEHFLEVWQTCTMCSGLNYSNLSGPATSHY